MAATQVVHLDLTGSEPADGHVFERLQYRIVQSKKPLGAASETDSQAVSSTAYPAAAHFPTHAGGLYGLQAVEKAPSGTEESDTAGRQAVAELERRLAEERLAAVQAIAEAGERGHREERQLLEKSLADEQRKLQTQLLQTLEDFHIERQRYFHNVEGEVVRLSLAIAARVLHRETYLDPMLLAGAVRVALDKLADSSSVVMRVAPAEAAKWKEFFRGAERARIQPGVLEDPSLPPGECLLLTELGSIELGVRAQLEEIEKGLFDLLDHRPAVPSPNPAKRIGSSN